MWGGLSQRTRKEKGKWGGGCDQGRVYTCMKLSKHKIKMLKKMLFSVVRFLHRGATKSFRRTGYKVVLGKLIILLLLSLLSPAVEFCINIMGFLVGKFY